MAILSALQLADPPELWADLGFRVESGRARVGTIELRLGSGGEGIDGWTLAAVEAPGGGTTAIDGLPTTVTEEPADGAPAPGHPNGVTGLDHVVVTTPDLERTVGALGQVGVFERRRRDAGRPGQPSTQVFFRLGEAILELVGPPEAAGDGPARFWGLAFKVSDMDTTAGALGERLRDIKSAVQPGRFIASLDRAAGSSIPIAFMTAGQGR